MQEKLIYNWKKKTWFRRETETVWNKKERKKEGRKFDISWNKIKRRKEGGREGEEKFRVGGGGVKERLYRGTR